MLYVYNMFLFVLFVGKAKRAHATRPQQHNKHDDCDCDCDRDCDCDDRHSPGPVDQKFGVKSACTHARTHGEFMMMAARFC